MTKLIFLFSSQLIGVNDVMVFYVTDIFTLNTQIISCIDEHMLVQTLTKLFAVFRLPQRSISGLMYCYIRRSLAL